MADKNLEIIKVIQKTGKASAPQGISLTKITTDKKKYKVDIK